jgi:sugar/nucleoside kinase (ribokinase family)
MVANGSGFADNAGSGNRESGNRERKMALLVTGSIGIDTVEAPWGRIEDALGGSCVYFAQAASYFAPVRLVGAVGGDCPAGFLRPLEENGNIDLTGLHTRPESKTFRWHGKYQEDVNLRDTVEVDLGVLGEAAPPIPPEYRDSRWVFLANTHPALQAELLGQLDGPELVVADTMDLWIENEREALNHLIGRLDGLVLNDSEARQMTGEANAVAAGMQIAHQVGRHKADAPAGGEPVGFVIVKKGEHGALVFHAGRVAAMPAFPSHRVVDPTGAGDSFAGGMMGYLAASGLPWHEALPRAVAYGTITASFTLEDFSLNRLRQIDRTHIDARLAEFEEMLGF